MPRPALHSNGNAAFALAHLAENGPTKEAELRELLFARLDGKQGNTSAKAALHRLESLGLVTTKVWLTPDGLDELKRMQALTPRAGVVTEEQA